MFAELVRIGAIIGGKHILEEVVVVGLQDLSISKQLFAGLGVRVLAPSDHVDLEVFRVFPLSLIQTCS